MKKINSGLNNSILAFCISFFLIGIILFFFPINLFPGIVVDNSSGVAKSISAPLSLSYFLGIGYEESDMIGIKDFYLTGKGYALAFCFLFGFPFLLALRIYYSSKKN